jgi:ribosomal protein S3AE
MPLIISRKRIKISTREKFEEKLGKWYKVRSPHVLYTYMANKRKLPHG